MLIMLIYVLATHHRSNLRLIVLVLVIIINSVFYSWSLLEFTKNKEDITFILVGITETFDTLAHWLISEVYLKLALEVTFLLNKSIYLDNQHLMHQYYRLNCWLKILNFTNILACLILLIYDDIVHDPISNGTVTVFCTILDLIYLVTWSFSLYQVFYKFKSSERLLP